MERQEAVRRLTKLFGAKMGYRVDMGAVDHDGRAAASGQLKTVRDELTAADHALSQRAKALCDADAEYQSLKTTRDELRARKSTLLGIAVHYRFTAGYQAHGFFHVEAQADTWEQVFAKLKEKYPNGKALR